MIKFAFNPLSCEFDMVADSNSEITVETPVTVTFNVMLGKDYTEAEFVAQYECGIDGEFALDDIDNNSSENYLFIIVPQGNISKPFVMDYITSNGIVIPTGSNSVVIDDAPCTCYYSNNPISAGMIENITIKLKQSK